MAIYTTFFLANPRALLDGFPGWKSPLPEPVRREIRNPFTKEMMVISTREPEWPADAQISTPFQARAFAIQGSYEAYIETRLPSFVRESRHWAGKGLTDIELAPLLGALGVTATLDSPIYAPPKSGAALREFPTDFIPKLLACDQVEIACLWAAAMSTPERTHSVSGKKLSEGWTTDEASQILTSILSLARQATSEQSLYLLVEA